MSVDETGQEMPSALSSPYSATTPKWLPGAGLAAGLRAVVASSCCVLPLGLASLGSGASILGVLNEITTWRVPLLSVSA